MTATAKYFIFNMPGAKKSLNRYLLGWELLGLQGFPMHFFDKSASGVTDVQKTDLAGNAFSSTVCAALVLSLLANVPKIPAVKDDEGDRMDLVVKLMSDQ